MEKNGQLEIMMFGECKSNLFQAQLNLFFI